MIGARNVRKALFPVIHPSKKTKTFQLRDTIEILSFGYVVVWTITVLL